MFTGIVQIIGRVAQTTTGPTGRRLLIQADELGARISTGESICVNGICLTHAPKSSDPGDTLGFDVIHETLDKTNLGQLKPADPVNLEPSLTPATPMGGHLIQGHIDGTGVITEVQEEDKDWRVTVRTESTLMPTIVPKGSIACDGVSLTLASVDPQSNTFTVALIPTTLELTTLGKAKAGDIVNLETDLMARVIVHWLRHYAGSEGGAEGQLTLEMLKQAGF